MAITFTNSVQNSATGTSVALGMPGGGPIAGNLIVLAIRVMNGVTITSITDTLNHNWSSGIPENPLAVGSDHIDHIRYVGKCLGGANTITINTSSSALICVAECEFSGFGIVGATLDQHNAASSTGTAVDSNGGNTTSVDEAAVGIYTGSTGNVLTTTGVPNNWSFRENAAANKLQFYTQTFTTLQTGVKLQGTVTSETWGALIATFKTGSGAGRRMSSVGDRSGSRAALIYNL